MTNKVNAGSEKAASQMENATQQQQEEWRIQAIRMREMVDRLPAPAVYIDNDNFIINRAAGHLTGYDPTEITSLEQWFATIYGDRAAEIRESYENDRNSYFPEITHPYLIKRKDGSERAVEFVAYRFDDHEIWLLYDVTERYQAEQALRTSEERLRAILNTDLDAIITIDHNGIISSINPATVRMFGYTDDELIGHNVSLLMPEPYRHEHDDYIRRYHDTGEARVIGKGGRETVARHKDGSVFPINLAINEIDHLDLFTGVIRDISDSKELEKHVLEIAAEEDRRIGIELHDNVQQQLTGLEMLAKSINSRLMDLPGEDSRFVEISDLMHRLHYGIGDAVKQIRMLARGLVPVQVDSKGLHAALCDLADRVSQQYEIQCVFHGEAPVEIRDNFIATHLYRITQEALNNAISHSHADRMDISLLEEDEHPKLIVSDNGVGLEKRDGSGPGMGLKIMQYRASVIGAQLDIGQNESGGTEVVCTIMSL